MFRVISRLNIKLTAARSRGSSNAAVRTVVRDAPVAKKQTPLFDISNTTFAHVWPSFNTKGLTDILEVPLPPTVNLVAIDSTSKKSNNNADVASILRFMILHYDEVLKLREGRNDSHPLVVVVRTSLCREDAETNDLVLSTALQQRERFKDITAVVLDAKQSSAAMSVLKRQKYASKLGDKKPVADANTSADATAKTTEVLSINKKSDCNDEEVNRQQRVANKATKTPNTMKNTTSAEEVATEKTVEQVSVVEKEKKKCQNAISAKTTAPITMTTTTIKNKKEVPITKETKKSDGDKKKNKENLASVSQTLVSDEVKAQLTPLTHTRNNTRESLRRMFQSSLAAPFQVPTHVERTLFSGYVDRVRLADLLNLPVYGDGDAYTLYYRLTGAGACRTPLITIAQIIKAECKKKLGGEIETTDEQSVNRVQVLLLLGASFLIREDANIMCQEYQNSLQKQMSLFADITVAVVPTSFTEKNVLFALKTAKIEGENDDTRCEKEHEIDTKPITGGNPLPLPICSRSAAESAKNLHFSAPTLSEDVLRSVVKGALEEVTLLHEKSTDHLVSTLKKLVAYWSRERVIELMESLQSERVALLDTTNELGEVQQQLRETKSILGELKKQVTEVNDKIKQLHGEEKGATSFGTSKVVECVRNLEERLVKSLSKVPLKEQITFDVREELQHLQNNLQCEMYKMLVKEFKEAQVQQMRDLQLALKVNTNENEKENKLTQQTLRELPQYIQSAVDKALQSFPQQLLEQATGAVKKGDDTTLSSVNDMCDNEYKSIEDQESAKCVGVDLSSTKTNDANVVFS